MLKKLFNSRPKLSRADAYRRRRLFETLETRRVFDADSAAVGMYVYVDPNSEPESGVYAPGDQVVVDYGLEVTAMSDVTVQVALYADTLNPYDFDETSDEFGNEYVAEDGPPIDVTTFTLPASSGGHYFEDFAFAAPGEGAYWLVMTVVDGDGNAALERHSVRIEVQGEPVGSEVSIDSITGPLVPGAPVEIAGSSGVDGSFNATWAITYDSDPNTVGYEETLVFHSEADLSNYTFTPTKTGNYQVIFAVNNSDHATAEFTVSSSSLIDGVLSFGTAAGGSSVVLTSNPAGATSVVVYGQGGNDIVLILPSVTVPVTVFGGAGNDVITGGSGNDLLVGGAGTDLIAGGDGRDLIIGGDGADILLGNASDDLLISGYTSLDADALAQVLAIWSGPGSFAARVNALRAGYLFNNSANPANNNVFDDDDIDLLTGNAGTDWIFANLVSDGQSGDRRDLVVDLSSQERSLYGELRNQ